MASRDEQCQLLWPLLSLPWVLAFCLDIAHVDSPRPLQSSTWMRPTGMSWSQLCSSARPFPVRFCYSALLPTLHASTARLCELGRRGPSWDCGLPCSCGYAAHTGSSDVCRRDELFSHGMSPLISFPNFPDPHFVTSIPYSISQIRTPAR